MATVPGIAFEDISFTETPTNIVREAAAALANDTEAQERMAAAHDENMRTQGRLASLVVGGAESNFFEVVHQEFLKGNNPDEGQAEPMPTSEELGGRDEAAFGCGSGGFSPFGVKDLERLPIYGPDENNRAIAEQEARYKANTPKDALEKAEFAKRRRKEKRFGATLVNLLKQAVAKKAQTPPTIEV